MPDDKRQHERFDVELPTTFVRESDRSTHDGVIRNIGLGGLLLETGFRLSTADRIMLYLTGGVTGMTKVPAVVVRYHDDSRFGVAFVSMSNIDQMRVRNIIAQNQKLRG